MKMSTVYLSAVLLLFGVFLVSLRAPAGPVPGNSSESGPRRPELEYFKAINSVAPPQGDVRIFVEN